VNVSALQLDSDALVEDVRAALDATGLDPKRLVLEVTESTLMHDPAAVARRMTALKTLGVRVAIDDFGTGYSSFSYLQQFPVDVLKIDRSFVAAMHESPHALALVEALIQLGRALGLNVIAEGVEEAGQLEMLRRVGLDTAQGYLFGRPLPGPDLKRFLDDWRQRQGAVATEIAPRRRARLHSVR
jgi:EAL domain-containing protein (putative c-di-GMP-specific phosphodiesterase class I)